MPHKQSSSADHTLPIPVELIERRIYLIRGHKVMMDYDLAELYQVSTKNLNKAVKRNHDRFPDDFMFQLTPQETEALRFQFGTSKPESRGGRRYLPYAFTEQGVAMLSSVLRSDRAVHVNIAVMRAFVQLRATLLSTEDLQRRLAKIEQKLVINDAKFKVVFDEIKKLMEPPAESRRQIGFDTRKE